MSDKGNVTKIPQFIRKANFSWQTRITWSATSVLEWAGEAVLFTVGWEDIQTRAEAALSPLTPGCGPSPQAVVPHPRLWSAHCTQRVRGVGGPKKGSAEMLKCLLPCGTAQSLVQGAKGVGEHREPLKLL